MITNDGWTSAAVRLNHPVYLVYFLFVCLFVIYQFLVKYHNLFCGMSRHRIRRRTKTTTNQHQKSDRRWIYCRAISVSHSDCVTMIVIAIVIELDIQATNDDSLTFDWIEQTIIYMLIFPPTETIFSFLYNFVSFHKIFEKIVNEKWRLKQLAIQKLIDLLVSCFNNEDMKNTLLFIVSTAMASAQIWFKVSV